MKYPKALIIPLSKPNSYDYDVRDKCLSISRAIDQMIDITALPGPLQGLTTAGIVLLEAILLHVGYGWIARLAGPEFVDAIRDP